MGPLGYVVHVQTPGTSGGETRSYQMAQALASTGTNIHLYGQIDPMFNWVPTAHTHQLRQPTPLGVLQLLRDFTRYRVGVVIERYHLPPFNPGFFAQRIRRRPIIFEVHGFPIDEVKLLAQRTDIKADRHIRLITRLSTNRWERMQQSMFRQAAHFIVTSTGTKSILMGMGVPSEQVSVIYNCVDPDLFGGNHQDQTIARQMLCLPETSEIILYAGSLFHEELTTIIEAAKQVVAVRPNACFVFAGVGPVDALHSLAHKSGLTKQQFRITPPVPHQQMPALLTAADVVLAPYRLGSERFRQAFHYSPLKVMEALAMEKLVVTIEADELCSMFGQVPNIHFAISGSASSWFKKIIEALDRLGDRTLAQGREFVLSGYRWEDAARRYLAIVRSIEAGP